MIKTEKTQLKALILCSYYNRPLLVRNTLRSVLKSHQFHQNWELAFGDDGSVIPGRPIVEDILKNHLAKVKIVETNLTFEDKIKKGLVLGKLANQIIRESDADFAIMLCDDDELVPDYLHKLSELFIKNPDILYCYSKIHLFNPFYQKTEQVNNLSGRYNEWVGPIDPVNKVDASQVAWRLACCKKHEAWFEETTKFIEGKPWTKDTDKSFFENLHAKCGLCHSTGFAGQFKGIHDYQLLWHKDVPPAGLWAYNKMYQELGGVMF